MRNNQEGSICTSSWRTLCVAFIVSIALMLPCSIAANAQTASNADAAYNGWISAYVVANNGAPFFANSLTDRSEAFMWGQAYMITGVEDSYDRTQSSTTKTLITNLLNRFEVKNHADLSWDSWNDDVVWAVIALTRGYEITGNTAFLNDATQAWNMAYNRGWDSTYGGGIWENMDNVPNGGKCGLSNWNFVFTGVMLYQATGDSTYLTKAEAIYSWARPLLFDTTTGRVYEAVGPTGVHGDDNYYNSGLIVEAANALYKVTNNSEYYNDAVLAASHVINGYPIMTVDKVANGDFGGDQFFRGLSTFARQNNIWSNYSTWLTNNATASWNERRTDYNITHNDFATATGTGNLDGMESEGSVVVQASLVRSTISGVHILVNSGNGITVDNGHSLASKAPAELYAWDGQTTQKWLFTQNSDSSWTITNQYSGMVLDDPGSSGTVGLQMQQYASNGGSNQHWLVYLQSDGSYMIVNQASNQALDTAGSSTNGAPLIQYTQNTSNHQRWLLK
jgi:predicted alpha-1,6-mannanase (GH76 family)